MTIKMAKKYGFSFPTLITRHQNNWRSATLSYTSLFSNIISNILRFLCNSIYACNEANLIHYLSGVYSVTIIDKWRALVNAVMNIRVP
jgi:hypothetical protein